MGVREKIDEELQELNEAVQIADQKQIAEELGDLLFAVVNLARHLKLDPEQALVDANRKFEQRYRHMEGDVTDRGESLADLDIDSLEQKWQAAKQATRS